MTARADSGPRNLLPRWRYTDRTPLTGEHNGPPTHRGRLIGSGAALAAAEAIFREHPTFEHAVELVGCAYASGRAAVAEAPARWLHRQRVRLPDSVAAAVEEIISGHAPDAGLHRNTGVELSQAQAREAIRQGRTQLQVGPRNVSGWLDLSLAHTVSGHSDAAWQAMRVALGLAPNHRVVLRTAARLLVHQRRVDQAYALIRQHPRTPHDPWLMALEVSLARMLQRSPFWGVIGRRFAFDNARQPAYITELAGATAAAESDAGEHRRARKLYALSLEAPTDNVLAQVQYVSQARYIAQGDDSLRVERQALQVPSAVEARMLRAMMEERWSDASACAQGWQSDEPFSSRSAISASYIAMCVGDTSLAIGSARAGLTANPHDQLLRNNLVYALARAGQHAEAAREFSYIHEPLQASYPGFVYLATQGLLAFIGGNAERGLELYEEAARKAPAEARPSVAVSYAETAWDFLPAHRRELLAHINPQIAKIRDPAARQLARRLVQRPVQPSTTFPAASREPSLSGPAPTEGTLLKWKPTDSRMLLLTGPVDPSGDSQRAGT
jgi:tetratricopeptide (TPR) repeat protein